MQLGCTHKVAFLMGLLLVIYAGAGCSESEHKINEAYVLRVEDRVLTVADFNKIYEIAKSAYPHNAIQPPGGLRDARVRLLKQQIEELILLERAEELGLSVQESEVTQAVEFLKQDYPEGVFEQTLLEFAVSFHLWEERVRARLLMEKVIAEELKEKINITSEDISKYYEQHFQKDGLNLDQAERSEDLDKKIIDNLRREKLEQSYVLWIKELQKKYRVEINLAQWKKILDS